MIMEGHALYILLLFASLFLAILSGMPALFAIAGAPLLVAGAGILAGSFEPSFLHAFPQRVFGMMGNQLFIALPLFVFMGLLLEKSGLARGMLIAANRLSGNSPRALVLSVLAASTLIAATTGIVGATIIMLGAISYPALIRAGISQKLASGLVVSAGTLGQIIPPSIVLIILSDQISVAYQEAQRAKGVFAIEPVTVSDIFAGAAAPGLLLVLLYAGYLVFKLGRDGANTVPAEQMQIDDREQKSQSLLLLLSPLFLILAVLGSIVFGIATPSEAAAIGASGTLLLASVMQQKQTTVTTLLPLAGVIAMLALGLTKALPADLKFPLTLAASGIFGLGLLAATFDLAKSGNARPVLVETIHLTGMIFGIVLAASLLSLVFRGFGGDILFNELAVNLPGEKWGALLVVMLVVFLLGFILEFIEIIFIVVPIAGPVLLGLDINPIWLAVLFALNLQTSFLTPPFGVALFYFRSVAPPDIETATIYRAIIPFVILQLVALFIVAMFPKIALYLPQLLFG